MSKINQEEDSHDAVLPSEIHLICGYLSAHGEQGRHYAAKLDTFLRGVAEDQHDSDLLRERMSGLLTGTANALKGDPPELTSWSWHDLPELATNLRSRLDAVNEYADKVVRRENVAMALDIRARTAERVTASEPSGDKCTCPWGQPDPSPGCPVHGAVHVSTREEPTWVCDGCMHRVTRDQIAEMADFEHVLCHSCSRLRVAKPDQVLAPTEPTTRETLNRLGPALSADLVLTLQDVNDRLRAEVAALRSAAVECADELLGVAGEAVRAQGLTEDDADAVLRRVSRTVKHASDTLRGLASVGPSGEAESGEADQHEHIWRRRQNVTTKGYPMPPYEVCECGAARPVPRTCSMCGHTVSESMGGWRHDGSPNDDDLDQSHPIELAAAPVPSGGPDLLAALGKAVDAARQDRRAPGGNVQAMRNPYPVVPSGGQADGEGDVRDPVAAVRAYLDETFGFYGDEEPDDELDRADGSDGADLRLSDLKALVALAARPVLSREAIRAVLDEHAPVTSGVLEALCTCGFTAPYEPGFRFLVHRDHLADVLAGGEQR